MVSALSYVTATNTALKRFTGLYRQKLYILDRLSHYNKPCTYTYLQGILNDHNCTIHYKEYHKILQECVVEGYITRSTCSRNVLYSITLSGKALLQSFCMELENIVKQDINSRLDRT